MTRSPFVCALRPLIALLLVLPALSQSALSAAQANAREIHLEINLTPEDDANALSTCLQQAAAGRQDLRLTSLRADWTVHINSFPLENGQARLLSLVATVPFDNKRDINRWMAGLPRPLSYGAHQALRNLTTGLERVRHHWQQVLPAWPAQAKDCQTILDAIVNRIL